MNSIRFNGDELHQLQLDLSGAPLRVQTNASSAVRRAAGIIDKQMTVDATGHQGNVFGKVGTEYDTPLQDHVSHEMLSPLRAEIGIEYKGAGKLAHIIAFGSANNAPVYDHMAGPRRALPSVEKVIADAAEDSVFGRKGKST